MRELIVYQVDSFTKEKFKGNPAGVVLDADSLSEAEMLKIARELNNSETAFILSPKDNSHDIEIRYFTPKMEVPICGHATIAAHYVRAIEQNLDSSIILSKTGIGILPVEIIKEDGDYSIEMTQGKIEFTPPFESDIRSKVLEFLGITEEDVNQKCPIQIVSTGHSKVIIGINSKEKLDSLEPNMEMLKKLSKEINCNGYFIFTFDSQQEGIYTHGRMFAPAIGIVEDPVTGNANGPLGAYLVNHNLIKHDGKEVIFNAEQGSAIGRSGIIIVKVKIEDNKAKEIKLKGDAVIVFKAVCDLA